MKQLTRHFRVGLAIATTALLIASPVFTSAAVTNTASFADGTTPDVFITEVQTNGGSAAQEFIELYNATDQDIDFADTSQGSSIWKLQFFNATSVKTGSPVWESATTASNAVVLTGVIPAGGYYLVSSTGYLPALTVPHQTYDASSSRIMTDTGGGLQLLSTHIASGTTSETTVHDRIMWLAQSTATVLPTGVYPSPGTGKSLQRLLNDDNEYVYADATLTEFSVGETISPLESWQAPVVVLPEVVPVPSDITAGLPSDTPSESAPISDINGPETPLVGESSVGEIPVDNTGLLMPQITEILPNPASPLTDAADEYIELYNPNAVPFDLKGYVLEVGTTTLHNFTFGEGVILPANGYLALYSADTKLTLTNSGGQAKLLNFSGVAISQPPAYTTAADDNAWGVIDGTWQWSTTATPGLANILGIVPAATAAATAKAVAAKTAATKTATAKKAAATTAKGTTTTKKAAVNKSTTKKAAKKKTSAKPTTLTTAAAVKPKPKIHTGILVAVAVAAVLYGLYEYRHDISNKYAKLRENRAARRGDRSQAAWRRGYSTE